METNMGLNTANAKEISLRLCKLLLAFYNASHRFIQKHPVISGVFSVCFILYIFLSYIYSFLVYLSPFIITTAIFIRIFWSSEQPQLIYVKRERRRSDFKHSRLAGKYGRSDFVLDRYYTDSSHHSTSRRRNCRDKKWGLHGGNNDFNNAFSEINTENKSITSSLERSRDNSSDDNDGLPTKKYSMGPNRKTLHSEPSMSDLVDYGMMEGIKQDDENEELKDKDYDDDRIKEGKIDSIDVGFLELERKTRMENLIKVRKELKMQLEKGVNPTHLLAPVLVTRNNSFKGSKRIGVDGTEMPESAPSIMRPSRTFNFLYNNSSPRKHALFQESPRANLKDRSALFSRHESFNADRSGRFPDKEKGSRESITEQLLSQCGTFEESDLNSPKPQSNFKEPERSNGFAETDQNMSSLQKAGVPEKPESRVHHMAPEKVLKFPISSSTTINESLFKSLASPTEKNHGNLFFAGRKIRKTPTNSIASDLQVEVSEVGSPTRGLIDSSLCSDEESSLYDGDNERDNYSSGSEDIWASSVHKREIHGIGEFEGFARKANINSNKDVLSAFPLQEIDEEISADVSSVSSTCGLPGDTPTCTVGFDQNLFGYMRETVMQNETAQPLNSLDVSSPSQANSERLEEWCSNYEDYKNEEEGFREMNDSATIDPGHIYNKTSNRDHDLSNLHEKSTADTSVQSNFPFPPRPVLPKKNPTDEVSSIAFDQQRHTKLPQSKMDDMEKTTSSGELHSNNSDLGNYQVSLINEKEVKTQTLENQESSDYFEGKQDDDSKENNAVSREREHLEEFRRVIQPKNFVVTTKQSGELPSEEKPKKMQHFRSGYTST